MPELTLLQIGLLTAAVFVGVALGRAFRSGQSQREKRSLNAGWQAQIDSQQTQHDRLAVQNESLMEQISQYQASNKDAKMRAKELSDSLQEAFARRDEMQCQMKDIRSNLEVAITQRDKLKSNVTSNSIRGEAAASTLRERDDDISKLKAELKNWQDRVPPLVERYRLRDLEAQQLEVELLKANDHIETLESMSAGEHTRIEPVDSSSLPDGLDASNEPHVRTTLRSASEIDATIEEPADDQPIIQTTDPANTADDVIDEPTNTARGKYESQSEPPEEAPENTAFPNVLGNNYADAACTRDDLKQIKGIGPAIANALNDLGIQRFSQIAEMSEYDIDRVAQQLKGFRSRIYREDWIGQARTLQYRKNHKL